MESTKVFSRNNRKSEITVTYNHNNSNNESGSSLAKRRLKQTQDFVNKTVENAEDLTEQLIQTAVNTAWEMTSYMHLPQWLQDNDCLLHGHRPQLNSYKACFRSIFQIHSETGNIWTHMIGCFSFIAIAICFFMQPAGEVKLQEKLAYAPFFLGSIFCMGISFVFHAVYCHSHQVGKIFNKLDYCGIALMIMGSSVTWIYYIFYHHMMLAALYFTVISVLGTATIIISLFDTFATPAYRRMRALVFIALGVFSGLFPVIHYMYLYGMHSAIHDITIGWQLLMGITYIFGACLYALRFPERYFPGKFDYWLQSHQLWHICVVAGAFLHLYGLYLLANFRLSNDPSAVPMRMLKVW